MIPEHVRVWNDGDRLQRQYLRRYWPELADALDISSVAEDFGPAAEDAKKIGTELHKAVEDFHKQQQAEMAARPKAADDKKRCGATHASQAWPYVGRCVLEEGHDFPYDHRDQHGDEWHAEPCDGCKRIKRMEEKLPPNDEDAAYHFQRAARHHRKECPNR